MPNGLAIMTANGIKEFPIPSLYGLEQGRLRFELKKLDVIFLQSLGDGQGLRIENIGRLGVVHVVPSSYGSKVISNIGVNGFALFFNDRFLRFTLSTTERQNQVHLAQLPDFLKRAIGDKLELTSA